MFKKIIFSIIITGSSLFSFASAENSDTLRLFYDINCSILTDNQLKQIDSLLQKCQLHEILACKISGFTDFLASEAYNKSLSQQRADNVKEYLSVKGISEYIKQCVGKGELLPEIENQSSGIPENRRVEIVILYKSEVIVQSTSNQLSKAKEGEHIILKNFNFQPGRHFLTKASQPELEILLYSLAENPTLHIEIQGYICCEYNGKDGLDQDTYTYDLSLNRAKYIYSYLIKNGIAAERLQYKGFGSTKPLIYPEKTLEDQDKNRRVEIVVFKN